MRAEFQECAACAAKPGSPDLCPSCLANRAAINTLNDVLVATEPPKYMRFAELVKLPYAPGGCAYHEADTGPHSNGYSFGTPVLYFQTEVLNFCACDDAESNLRYIRDSLALVGEEPPEGSWQQWYPGHRARINAHFKSEHAEAFMWYWLDSKGFTEHGSRIPGWLTESGKELLEDLTSALEWKEPIAL